MYIWIQFQPLIHPNPVIPACPFLAPRSIWFDWPCFPPRPHLPHFSSSLSWQIWTVTCWWAAGRAETGPCTATLWWWSCCRGVSGAGAPWHWARARGRTSRQRASRASPCPQVKAKSEDPCRYSDTPLLPVDDLCVCKDVQTSMSLATCRPSLQRNASSNRWLVERGTGIVLCFVFDSQTREYN